MIDLEFLKMQSGESEEIMEQMIQIFIETAPEQIITISNAFKENDADGLMAASHAFLSSLKILNAEAAIALGEKVESHLKGGGEISAIQQDVSSLIIICNQLVEEAKNTKI